MLRYCEVLKQGCSRNLVSDMRSSFRDARDGAHHESLQIATDHMTIKVTCNEMKVVIRDRHLQCSVWSVLEF